MCIRKDFVKPLEFDIKVLLSNMELTIDAMMEQSEDEEFVKYGLDAELLKLTTNKIVSCIDRLINHIQE